MLFIAWHHRVRGSAAHRSESVYFGLREEEVNEQRSTDLSLLGPALLALCVGAALAAAISVFVVIDVVGEDGARVAAATMLGVVIWTVVC